MRKLMLLTLGLAIVHAMPSVRADSRHVRFNVIVSTAQTVPGGLDPTFSGDGRQITDVGGSDSGRAVAIQSDGKIVMVGTTYVAAAGFYNFALARYDSDGLLDATFSADGIQTTDFGVQDHATAVAIQADGKIVVVGSCTGSGTSDFALARYHADGSLDPSFSGDGKQTTDFAGAADSAHGVAVQADGTIVVAGYAGGDFGVARYNADGSLDTSFPVDKFPADGKQTTDFGGFDAALAMAIQADGRIMVAGYTDAAPTCDWCEDPPPDFALARYNADGSLDTSFSGDGKQTTDFGGDDYAAAVALQADGKIVVVGSSYSYQAASACFALARYNSDGSLDYAFGWLAPFGWGGRVTTQFTGADWASGVALQTDGKIVVVGDSGGDFAMASYDSDGSLDATFSGGGTQTTDFGGLDFAAGVALQLDGKIVAVGGTVGATGVDFALARYHGIGGSPDTTPPDTTITGGPTGTTDNSTPAFTFDSSEAGSTFACRVDGTPFSACSSPYTAFTLSDGSHTFDVRAIDTAGNLDTSPASRSFAVDTAPPDTSVTSVADGNGTPLGHGTATLSKVATITFAGTDNVAVAGFECSLDGAAFTSCSSPWTRGALAVGRHDFAVKAVDTSSNRDGTPALHTWSVDSPPDTTITSAVDGKGKLIPKNGTTRSNAVTFSFTATDNLGVQAFECSLDQAAFTACASPATRTVAARGSHTFRVRAIDTNGFRDATPASFTWTR